MTGYPVNRVKDLRKAASLFAVICLTAMIAQCGPADEKGLFVLEPLPYAEKALQPHISAETISFHYGKHHAGYVKRANSLVTGSVFEGNSFEEIIKLTSGKKGHVAIFNNVAQAWNHAFFWKCMKPRGGGSPKGKLAKKIKDSFGSLEAFKEEFLSTANSQFGSGWTWLVLDGDKLKVVKTSNADTLTIWTTRIGRQILLRRSSITSLTGISLHPSWSSRSYQSESISENYYRLIKADRGTLASSTRLRGARIGAVHMLP